MKAATLLSIACLALAVPAGAKDKPSLILATTTSTQDSGLLDLLVPRFEKLHGIEVKVIAVGSGAALRMAAAGNADAALVHAPDAERVHVQAGDLIEGQRVMHNDFVLLGPKADPAAAGKQPTVGAALKAIAEHGSFVSRGDDSGTHKQELQLWAASSIDPGTIATREETGQGMGATLHLADQRGAYTLTDRATFLALRKRLDLQIVFQGDPSLRNVYHAYVVSPKKHKGVNAAAARKLVAFLVSPDVQEAIGAFRRDEYGESLFVPAAPAPAATK